MANKQRFQDDKIVQYPIVLVLDHGSMHFGVPLLIENFLLILSTCMQWEVPWLGRS